MLTYILSGSNQYTLRTEPTASSEFTMSLQDMTELTNSTASLSGITYNGYESMLNFTASIVSASAGQEFRAILLNGTTEIWHGSVQVFSSQSQDTKDYRNQIPLDDKFVSNVSTNEYIIL